jgi:PrcB C-terminal
VALAIAGGVLWTRVVEAGGAKPVPWRDVTAGVGPVLWPKSVARSFWTGSQLERYLARTFPHGQPEFPRFDFAHRRLILVAAGPRSSSGYGVRIASVTDRRGGVRVLARETAPSLAQRVVVGLTSPYRLITIPATRKRVSVQWEGR